MSYRMAYRVKRGDSPVEKFRMRVPESVKDRVRGRRVLIWFPDENRKEPVPITTTIGSEVKFSLRTHDPAIAEHRRRVARIHLQQVINAVLASSSRHGRTNAWKAMPLQQ